MNGNRDFKIGNVGILEGKKISRDSKDTRADSFRLKDQAWSSHGPYRVPERDLNIFKNIGATLRLCLPFPH